MATISKTGISTGQAITANQILNIIEALDGTDNTNIVISGSTTLSNVSQSSTGINVLTVDGDGIIYKTGSYSGGGGGSSTSPGSPANSVQFNDGGSFGGDSNFTFNKSSDTLTVTNITASVFGTASNASNAISSSYAVTASYAENANAFPFSGTASISGQIKLTGPMLIDDALTGDNIGIGAGSSNVPLFSSLADSNIAIGKNNFQGENAQDDNVSIGTNTLSGSTAALQCVAIGKDTMKIGTGNIQYNVAIGTSCLENLTDKSLLTNPNNNIAIGISAGRYHYTLDDCIAIGAGTMMGKSGDFDDSRVTEYAVAIGSFAGYTYRSGSGDVFIGYEAGKYMSGQYNTEYKVKKNVMIGYQCVDSKQNGDGNTYIGANITAYAPGGSTTAGVYNEIVIGADATGNGTSTIQLGNTSISEFHCQVALTVDSDERVKRNVESGSLGLSFINSLNPVRFQKVNPAEWPSEIKEPRYTDRIKYDENDQPYTASADPAPVTDEKYYDGLIAQEVSASLSTAGIESDIWCENGVGKQGIKYEILTIPLIKAVQELTARVEALEAQINGGM